MTKRRIHLSGRKAIFLIYFVKKNVQTPYLFQPRQCYIYETEQENLWSVSQLCFNFADWHFAFIHEIMFYEYIHVHICAWMYVQI